VSHLARAMICKRAPDILENCHLPRPHLHSQSSEWTPPLTHSLLPLSSSSLLELVKSYETILLLLERILLLTVTYLHHVIIARE
jgi:hypothetical protein